MKLVTRSTDTSYLYALKGLLEANGIPASVQGDNTARMITPYLMTQPGLWVYLDEQHQDAINLVNDEDYIVMNKIDVDEFYKLNENITSDTSVMNEAYIKLVVNIFAWLLGAFLVFKFLVWLST